MSTSSSSTSSNGGLTCTADAPPEVQCFGADQAAGTTCTSESGGGCPNLTTTWTCQNGEGGLAWFKTVATDCDCTAAKDLAACEALGGCGWAKPDPTCEPMDVAGTAIKFDGCYATGCEPRGFGRLSNNECSETLCIP
jgi:hypothetical protein